MAWVHLLPLRRGVRCVMRAINRGGINPLPTNFTHIEEPMILERIQTVFDEEGQRRTRPRQLIAERLAKLAEKRADFTIDELWQELRQDEPKLGRATVYRSVELLVNASVLDRIEFADGTHHYRVCGGIHHHHLTCTQCHQVVEINICLPIEQLKAIGN